MALTEVSFWKEIRKHFSKCIHFHRVENSVIAGTPDSNLCRDGVDVWLELKILHSDRITVRYSQLLWARQRVKAGARNIFFIARDESRVLVWKAITMLARAEAAKGQRIAGNKRVREDKSSMTFDPGAPDKSAGLLFTASAWGIIENFLFDTAASPKVY